MSSKSKSVAKGLALLSIVIGLTSGYFASEWAEASAGLTSQVRKLAAAKKESEQALAELRQALPASGGAGASQPIDSAVADVMLLVYNNRVKHGITLSSVSPGKKGVGSSLADLTRMSETVPGTSVKSVKVNLSGTYATYHGLLAYLEALQDRPVALVKLSVVDRTFDASLRIYGTGGAEYGAAPRRKR